MAAVTDLASFCAAVGFDAEDLLHTTDDELAELLEEYGVKGRAKIQVKKELRLGKAAAAAAGGKYLIIYALPYSSPYKTSA